MSPLRAPCRDQSVSAHAELGSLLVQHAVTAEAGTSLRICNRRLRLPDGDLGQHVPKLAEAQEYQQLSELL